MSTRTPPRGTPVAGVVAPVLALLLLALAVVAVRDLMVAQGWSRGTPWVLDLVRALDGTTASIGVVVVGVVVGLVGLVLVLLALRPAPRTHLAGNAEADLWLTPRALAELARTAADRTAGVVAAEVGRTGRRRVSITVLTRRDAAGVAQQVESALDERVRALADTTVAVRTKEVDR